MVSDNWGILAANDILKLWSSDKAFNLYHESSVIECDFREEFWQAKCFMQLVRPYDFNGKN